jgi:hypothetical protein
MAKLGFVSFLFTLWLLIFYWEFDWFLFIVVIIPLTAVVAGVLAFILDMILKPIVEWFNK